MQNTFVKYLVRLVLVVAIFALGFYAGAQQVFSPSENKTVNEQQAGTVRVVIDYGTSKATFEQLPITEGQTVFDVLKIVARDNNIAFEYQEYEGLGVLVNKIGDLTNDVPKNLYWQFWLNGEFSNVGAAAATVSAGDSIEWKYTEQTF